jgi:hypothetical protein
MFEAEWPGKVYRPDILKQSRPSIRKPGQEPLRIDRCCSASETIEPPRGATLQQEKRGAAISGFYRHASHTGKKSRGRPILVYAKIISITAIMLGAYV